MVDDARTGGTVSVMTTSSPATITVDAAKTEEEEWDDEVAGGRISDGDGAFEGPSLVTTPVVVENDVG